jgi:hypothetical protein
VRLYPAAPKMPVRPLHFRYRISIQQNSEKALLR